MTSTPERVHYLDWIRVTIVLLLIPFHSALLFRPYYSWLSNDPHSLAAKALLQVLDQFNMEILFLVAGASTWFSLSRRTGGEYLLERLKRLFIPIMFAMLVLRPPSRFLATVNYFSQRGLDFNTSFFEYYPTFLQKSLLPFQESFSSGVLWFLWYLFFYTLALLPLFLFIRRGGGQRFLSWLAAFGEKRGALFLLVIPIALLQIYPPPSLPNPDPSQFPILYYPIFFIYGFLLYSDPRWQRGIEKSGPIALVGGAITMVLFMLLVFPDRNTASLGAIYWTALGSDPGTLGDALYWALRSFNCWFWLIGLLYLGKKFFNFSNRFLRYGNETVLPFYIMHNHFILLIGFYIVQLNMDVLPKYAIIAIAALAATAGFCELIIRRINVVRFLFGMRLKQKLLS